MHDYNETIEDKLQSAAGKVFKDPSPFSSLKYFSIINLVAAPNLIGCKGDTSVKPH